MATEGAKLDKVAGVEIDWDRVQSDPDYEREVNEKIAAADAAEEPPQEGKEVVETPPAAGDETPPEDKSKDEVPAEADDKDKSKEETAGAKKDQPPTGEDDDPVIETVPVRGRDVPIRKSQLRDLLIKGRLHEMRMQELHPALRGLRARPELMDLFTEAMQKPELLDRMVASAKIQPAKDGTVNAEKRTALKTKLKEKYPDYSEQSIEGMADIIADSLEHLAPPPAATAAGERPLDTDGAPKDDPGLAPAVTTYVGALRAADPERFEANRAVLLEYTEATKKAFLAQGHPIEAFNAAMAAVNDPRVVDEASGEAYATLFWRDLDAYRIKKTAGAAPPKKPPRPPTNTVRLEAGAEALGVPGGMKNYDTMDDEALNKEFEEALRKVR